MSATQPSLAPRVVSRPELSVDCKWFFPDFRTLTGCACDLHLRILHRESLGSLKFMEHERICLQLAHAHELKHHTFGLLRSIGSSSGTGGKTELKVFWNLMELVYSFLFCDCHCPFCSFD